MIRFFTQFKGEYNSMKKSVLILMAGLSLLSLASCSKKDDGDANALKIALVTDSGTLNDHNFNETSWNAVNDWAIENGGGTKTSDNVVTGGTIETKYYQPSAVNGDFTTAQRVSAIDSAVEWGAKFVVLPGYLFQPVVKKVQAKYPNVSFLALDCVAQDSDDNYTEYTLNDNVAMTQYHEEQAGWFAGYGAVKDGLTKLGFIGGMAVPAVKRYGFGYIQGAEAAAKELGLNDEAVNMEYYYAGQFASTPEATDFASKWYASGTETIFACGGAVYNSVTTALSTSGKDASWIGVDTNQHADTSIHPNKMNEKVLTSATKGLAASIKSALTEWNTHDHKFDAKYAGKTLNLGIKDDAVGLATPENSGDSGCWNFKKWTVADYNAAVTKMKNGEITVSSDVENLPTTKKVKVTTHNK